MQAEDFNRFASRYLPGQLDIRITQVDRSDGIAITAQMPLSQRVMSPNDVLHGGAISVLADTAAGCGCLASLPDGATGFLTLEMKSNLLGAISEGVVECVARATHRGRSTQVWDAVLTELGSGRTLALFRCTQLILYRAASPGDAPWRS